MSRSKEKRWLRLQRFFARHSRMFAMIGGLIVLSTFIVKERLQDGWTKQADAIRAARYQYLEHELSSESLAIARYMRADLDMLRSQEACKDIDVGTPPTKTALDRREFVFAQTHRLEMFHSQILDTDDHLANLQLLVPTLPKGDQAEFEKVAKVFRDNPVTFFQTTEFCNADDDFFERVQADYKRQGANLYAIDGLLLRTIDPIRQKLPKEANEIIEADEKKAARAAWISAILYALGWALSLADKLVGVGEAAIGE